MTVENIKNVYMYLVYKGGYVCVSVSLLYMAPIMTRCGPNWYGG